jgi:hypothetical protein
VRTHLGVLAVAALLGVAGCTSAPVTPAPKGKHVAFVINGCLMSVSTDQSVPPVVSKPATPVCEAAPPLTQTVNVVQGHGPAATSGDAVGIRYVGLDWVDPSKQVDSNWGKAAMTISPLGSSQVIAGFNIGLQGVHVGDRVVIVVPATDAFGSAGASPLVRPNENLLYVADILSLVQASAVPTPSG